MCAHHQRQIFNVSHLCSTHQRRVRRQRQGDHDTNNRYNNNDMSTLHPPAGSYPSLPVHRFIRSSLRRLGVAGPCSYLPRLLPSLFDVITLVASSSNTTTSGPRLTSALFFIFVFFFVRDLTTFSTDFIVVYSMALNKTLTARQCYITMVTTRAITTTMMTATATMTTMMTAVDHNYDYNYDVVTIIMPW
ncbi:hypothetical protein EDB89DRAFT_1927115 [Lactarius sanguifluus]|nr:hypothetical protein EDB89DRAFT_1927115 [Lactarius sanguifluus]